MFLYVSPTRLGLLLVILVIALSSLFFCLLFPCVCDRVPTS